MAGFNGPTFGSTYSKIKKNIEKGFIAVGKSLSQNEIIENLKSWLSTQGLDNYKNLKNKPKLSINGEKKELVDTVEFIVKSGDKPYLSVKRLGKYLYEATFDSIPPYVESVGSVAGGCTSFVRDGKLYRSFDLTYNNTAEFIVITKEFDGIALVQGLNDGELDDSKLSQLPYHLADGINRDSIKVSEHVLNNDFGFEGTGTKSNDLTTFPYFLLTHLHSIEDITTNPEIANFLANCKVPTSLSALDYLLHFLVTDGTTTYNITPKSDGSGYEIIDITTVPKITNFKHTGQPEVSRYDMDMQMRPTGIERFNSINSSTTLEDLRFTKCYEAPNMLTEFIGDKGTTKYSTDEELTELYNEAHEEYIKRKRDGKTWQSLHAVVYGAKGIEHLWVQEDYEKDYVSKGGGGGGTGNPDNKSLDKNIFDQLEIKGYKNAADRMMPVKDSVLGIDWVVSTDEETVRRYAEQAQASATQSGTYATQSGNSAIICMNKAEEVNSRFLYGVGMDSYKQAVDAGLVKEDTIFYVLQDKV